jgi:sec-independent protein translocase protein TatC
MTATSGQKLDYASGDFDPDQYRMTIGEHLDELRRRLILGLIGFAVALVFCLVFGQRVTAAFCAPLIETLQSRGLNPQVYYTDVADAFMVFLKISLISAAAIASPWLLYQVWLFVAAGLYPNERKYVKRFAPLSILLLIGGMAFVYWLVLPWTLVFFIDFGADMPLPAEFQPNTTLSTDALGTSIASLDGDPAVLEEGKPMIWFNYAQNRLKVYTGHAEEVRVIPFGPSNLAAPMITLPNYISLVFGMLITFGLCFQLPLVVMAIARMGIVDLETLRGARKYVYFVMAIVATIITPGDVITVTLALMVPLILLYELGLWMSQIGARRRDAGE